MSALFANQQKAGSAGEALIINYLRERGHSVIDVSLEPEYYHKGDLIVAEGILIEVKTDKWCSRTNNLFLEYERDYNGFYCDDGWFRKCSADYLFYLEEDTRVCYVYALDELKEYVKINHRRIPRKVCDDRYKQVFAYALDKDAVTHQTIQL